MARILSSFMPRRIALITGAGRGRSAAHRLRRAGASALFVHADIAAPGAAERVIRATTRRFGTLDCVVNNAGIIEVDRLDEVRGTGVRVYAVCPSAVDTPMARKAGVARAVRQSM
jgi:NAD(P)-dependent dehydrogenase (short-subunit alcohol dehydrogenase family)